MAHDFSQNVIHAKLTGSKVDTAFNFAEVLFLLVSVQAEKFEQYMGKNPVLALKGVKVSEFGGRYYDYFIG